MRRGHHAVHAQGPQPVATSTEGQVLTGHDGARIARGAPAQTTRASSLSLHHTQPSWQWLLQ
jgi:hypothetical protein